MSTNTTFKRISLAVVVALGIGLMGSPSSQAAVSGNAIALASATSTTALGDTATNVITHTFQHTSDAYESATVRYTCVAPSTSANGCPALFGQQLATADTANLVQKIPAGPTVDNFGTWYSLATKLNGSGITGWTDSSTNVATGAVRSVFSVKATGFDAAGTYTYSIYSISAPNGTDGLQTVVSATQTWTVTVTAPNTTGTSLSRFYLTSDMATATNARAILAPSIDSAIVVSAGTAATPVAVGYAFITTANSAGDTRVAVGSGYLTVDESITVTASGPGSITSGNTITASGTKAKSATLNSVGKSLSALTAAAGETLTIYSDGTAGTMTLTFTTRAGTVIKTATVTFTGTAASAGTSLSDTYTYIGASGVTFNAQVKDAGGNVLTAGTFYVFSSDTKIVSTGASLYANGADQYQTAGRCSATWNTTTKTLACPLTISDTGTASIYFADSWNVTASSFVTTALTLTVSSNVISTATVAFDKATYAPGERAVITITAKDIAGRLIASHVTAGSTVGTASRIDQTPTLSISSTTPYVGTNSGSTTSTLGFTSYQDTGVETRVVTMPTYGTDVTYTMTFATDGRLDGSSSKTFAVTATAKVIDPSQAAQNTAIANAQAAADAATDAALQAIDAANAATDAANLAAEAADAATVAAQESKDSADAATAAVESLATQVATLMAALQAQITSLANVVAKIAKKVKA